MVSPMEELTPLARHIWETRYRADAAEASVRDTWMRVARAAASLESEPERRAGEFLELLSGYRFLPGGRILATAGTARTATLANCFVMGAIEDSVEGICAALREGAITLQQGGGVGYDFSTLRPRGFAADAVGAIASGPVSFMRVFDALCATIASTGARRGAMMATLRCDHPDIEDFIAAKRAGGVLSHFNLSVLVTDEFMGAVRGGRPWPLVFPVSAGMPSSGGDSTVVMRRWSGSGVTVPCAVCRTVDARQLWDSICAHAHASAEPGVLFVDRINEANNLRYCEWLSATNPCGEAPLPPYGACLLGSINLVALVRDPFGPGAYLDAEGLAATARMATRFLDNLVDVSRYPLPRQAEAARNSRRIGIGITGLADALAMLGLRYDSAAAREAAAGWMRAIRDAAYAASVDLAGERGAFPAFDPSRHAASPFIRALPEALQARIRAEGIRNSHLLAIAPTGTISLLAGNISSGIEPVFGLSTVRRVMQPDGGERYQAATDAAYALWRRTAPAGTPLPAAFMTGAEIAARDHLLMQASLQPFVDGAISKTVQLARDTTAAAVAEVFGTAFDLGLKGCTVFRAGSRTGVVSTHEPAAGHCREVDRVAA